MPLNAILPTRGAREETEAEKHGQHEILGASAAWYYWSIKHDAESGRSPKQLKRLEGTDPGESRRPSNRLGLEPSGLQKSQSGFKPRSGAVRLVTWTARTGCVCIIQVKGEEG